MTSIYEGKEAGRILEKDPSFRCDRAPVEDVKRVIAETGKHVNRLQGNDRFRRLPPSTSKSIDLQASELEPFLATL